ncbi:MAG: hypothetical protein HC906_18215 [Bacteroidales bacterium]|nr:hypothetical protein [Bacteroidales bacterium]
MKEFFVYDKNGESITKINISAVPLDTTKILGWCNHIYIDTKDNLWIGTTEGLYQISNNLSKTRKITVEECPILKNSFVLFLGENSKNELLICTSGGLCIMDLKEYNIKTFTIENGLPEGFIFSVLEDKNQNLWVSSSRGISRLTFSGDYSKLVNVLNFSSVDGLQSDFFIERASYKTKDGMMFFGGVNGINYFHPDSFTFNKIIPKIEIDEIIIQGKRKIKSSSSYYSKRISDTREIELPYWQNFITLKYIAFNYIKSSKNKYSVFLQGFDEDWKPDEGSRSTTYMNLKPGKYIFMVKGSNNDGIWNEIPATLNIKINPPYYGNFWAYLFYFFIFTLLLYYIRIVIITRERLKTEIEQINRELEKDNKKSENKILDYFERKLTLNSYDEKFLEKLIQVIEMNFSNSDFNVLTLSKDVGIKPGRTAQKN